MADEKKTVILDFQVDGDDAVKSIEKLTAANKALREERKKVDLSTEEGIKRVKEINKAIDENDKVIKSNSSSLEKQRLNVGNYTGALDKLIPGLGATANGFSTMTKTALGFIATPIGVVLAAVAAAIALIGQYFTRTEAGADAFSKIMAQLTAIMNVFLDRAAQIGSALAKLFTGDFIGAVTDTKKAFSGLTDEIVKEANEAGKLAELLDSLEDRERSNSVALSESTLEVKRLTIESKNRNLTEQERIDLLQKAIDIEKKANEQTKQIALDKLSAATKQIELDFNQLNITKLKGESEKEFAKRIVDNADITGAARDKVAEALKNLNEVEGESFNIQEKLANMIDAQNIKQEEKAKKAEEEAKRKSEQDDQELIRLEELNQKKAVLRQQELDAVIADYEARQALREKETADMISEFDKQLAADKKAADDEYKIQRDNELKKSKLVELTEKSKQQSIGATANLLGSIANLQKKNSIAQKGLASGEIIINTALGISQALRAPATPFIEPFATITRIAQAITIGLNGARALAQVNGVQFKQGGYTGDGDPNQIAGEVHKGEFVMPADVVSKYGKDTFQSFMDGSIVANAMTSGMQSTQSSKAPVVYLNYTEFKKFQNEVQFKEEVVKK